MTRLFALFALAFSALALPGHAIAQDFTTSRTIATERWVEEWDPASQRWVRVSDSPSEAMAAGTVTSISTTHVVNGAVVQQTQTVLPAQQVQSYALPVVQPKPGKALAQYGPFRVLDGKRAAIVGSTDHNSPGHFEALLRNHPGLEVLEMHEAPGTRHDIANLKVGRMIRAAGLRTHVPTGGSVRSGAVELFLAGTEQTMERGAQFAVHSWLDSYGRQPQDFPADHSANRLYLDYYMEMGMSERQAREFYAMTNSVPHTSALWLTDADMRPWVSGSRAAKGAQRMLALAEMPLVPLSFENEPALALFAFDIDASATAAHMRAIEPAPQVAADLAYIESIRLSHATPQAAIM